MSTMEDKKEAIYTIIEKDGVCQPEALVEYAQPETSPIHDSFEWDDSEAGEQYRLWQARKMIKTVTCVYGGEYVQQYKNVIVKVEVEGDVTVEKQGYVSFSRVMEDKNLHKQVLREAIKNIRKWQNDYRQLTELKKVIDEKELSKVEALIK